MALVSLRIQHTLIASLGHNHCALQLPELLKSLSATRALIRSKKPELNNPPNGTLSSGLFHAAVGGPLLVEPGGFEPPTPCLQSRCSPS
jgi:hypothetical protein